MGPSPLRERFPRLYAITTELETSVARARSLEGWSIPFRQQLGLAERTEWTNLMREIEHISLSGEADSISWALEPSGLFSVRSLYRKLCTGTPTKQLSFLWSLRVPLKIRIFLWQLARKRLPSNDNIHRRHGPSNGLCVLWERVRIRTTSFLSVFWPNSCRARFENCSPVLGTRLALQTCTA